MDYKEHFARLERLILIEREEERKQYQLKIRNKSITYRRDQGVTWYPVAVNKTNMGTGGRWTVQLERTKAVGKRHLFQPGSSASIFAEDGKIVKSVNGVVTRVENNTLRIIINQDNIPKWLYDHKLGVDLLYDESTYNEMKRMLKKMQSVHDGRLFELVEILLGKSIPSFAELNQKFYAPGLNNSQCEAIKHVMEAKDVAVVHGPPGTGKTTTLVHSIIEVLQKEHQVLVTTASNSAIDLIVEKLALEAVSVLRIGHPGRVDEVVVNQTLDQKLTEHSDSKRLKDLRKRSVNLKNRAFKFKRSFGRSEREQRRLLLEESNKLKSDAYELEQFMVYQTIDTAQVIACTLIGSNSEYLKSRKFGTVFIDEASQAIEPASWIAISKANKVVMAGDHQQLPPTVKSLEASKLGLSTTLFERAIKKQKTTMLKVQYRMEDQIQAFSNQYFYDGQVGSDASIQNRRKLFNDPTLFIDTAGCGFDQELDQESLSTFNTANADFTLSYLNRVFTENHNIRDCSIGIITPYRAQVLLYEKKIRQFEWFKIYKEKITINSVDGFQGQERDVILIDFVRSNDDGEIGFLADVRRTNVAMTRARKKVIMVGDSATLSNHPFYDNLISFYQKNSWYHSAFEYIY